MICVSKCLLGENCRYDGKNCRNEKVLEYLKEKEYVAVCPEQLGGLPTPRYPSEIKEGKVVNRMHEDVSDAFCKGAFRALKIAKDHNCKVAILKEYSPSCGMHYVYDGSFSGNVVEGKGVCATLFDENGINCISSEEFK